MTLLEDARHLAADDPECANRLCHHCGSPGKPIRGREIQHTPDCPWLSMPKIVAALEAAERLASAWAAINDNPLTRSAYLIASPLYNERVAAERALVAALKDDVVPQESSKPPS